MDSNVDRDRFWLGIGERIESGRNEGPWRVCLALMWAWARAFRRSMVMVGTEMGVSCATGRAEIAYNEAWSVYSRSDEENSNR